MLWLQLFALGGGPVAEVEEEIDLGVPIINLNAETLSHSGYEIDDKSGRKCYPGELIQDPFSKMWTLPEYADTQQREHMRYRTVKRDATPRRTEQDTNFITETVSADDL